MQKLATVLITCALVGCGADPATPMTPAAPSGTASNATPSASPVSGAAGGPASVTSPAPTTPSASQPAAPANTPAVTPPASTMPPSAATPAAPSQTPAQPSAAAGNPRKLAMDECGLHTKYPGDEYCIKAPAPDKGFQLHIGPTNYDSPEAKYLLQPGDENVVNLTAVSGNDKDVNYYWRQYRMRPGSHHVILTADGKRIGGTQNLARDNPDNGIVPPENAGVGLPLGARANINANMHFYNFTDKPMVRELWVNYWYKDAATVTETAKSVFSMTGVSAAKAHTHVVVGASCAVQGSGRILSMSGHRHLNNVRFSAWLNSGGKKTLIFDDYDSEHPGYMEFNSLTQNPAPNPAMKALGGASGVVNVKQGDTLDFECEILNNTDKNFVGLNEAQDDEMCILTGDTVGAQVSAGCTPIQARNMTAN